MQKKLNLAENDGVHPERLDDLKVELRVTREAFEERTRFLDAVLDSIDTGIVACDAQGSLTYFNRASREIHGLRETPLSFDRWPEYYGIFQSDGKTPMSPDEVPLIRALRGEQVRNVEIVVLPRNRRRRCVLVTGKQLRDAQGERMGAVVAMHDVTELKIAKRSTLQSEMFLDSIIENIPNMIFVKDAEGLRFVRFNRAGEELLGCSRDDLIGKSDYDLFPKEQADAFTTQDRAVLSGRCVVDIPEEPILTPAGNRTLHTKKIPILDPEGRARYLLGISEDITTKKLLEEQKTALLIEQRARADAEAFNEELRKERRMREEFVDTLTHDLKNPLSAAKNSAELLRRHPDKADARERLVNRIIVYLERSERMIKDLLDANLIRAGSTLPLRITECDLSRVLSDVLEEMTLVYGERFVLHAPEASPGFWSEDSLRRILENLVQNAIKYGSPDAPVTVALSVDEERGKVTLSVHNEGEPIPQDEQSSLFTRFHRSRSALRGGQKGWGLGLLLVRGIAEAHGGEVSVESAKDFGTRFSVVLPMDSRPFQQSLSRSVGGS